MKFLLNHQLIKNPVIWILSGIASVAVAVLVVMLSFFSWFRDRKYFELFIGFWIILIFADSAVPYLGFSSPLRPVILFLLVFVLFSGKTPVRINPFFYAFIPFAIYSILSSFINYPILFVSFQKALSYLLLLIVVPSFVQYLREKDEEKLFRYLVYSGYFILGVSIVLYFVLPRFGAAMMGRLNGIFRNPNGIGIYAALFGMLAIVIFNFRPSSFSRKDHWTGIVLISLVLLLSGSRNSMVSLLLFIMLVPLCRISNITGILFVVVLGVFGFWLLNNLEALVADLGYAEFFRLDTLDMASGRIYVWEAAWLEIQQKGFWAGEGFAYAEEVRWMGKYYEVIPDLVQHQGNIHNSYLTFWMNIGLIGMLLFFVPLIGYFFKAMFKTHFAFPLLVSAGFLAFFESWLTASLNSWSIIFYITLTLLLQGKYFPPTQKEVSLHLQKTEE